MLLSFRPGPSASAYRESDPHCPPLAVGEGIQRCRAVPSVFVKNKARSAMTICITLTAIIYLYGTLGIYNFEAGIKIFIVLVTPCGWLLPH